MKTSKLYDDQLIVITGAAGFIGSGVVRFLNDRGLFNLLLVDDFGKSEKWKNLLNKRYYDLISKETLFDFLKGREQEIEAFIHLGACSSTTETDGNYLMENNYRFSQRLAEYAFNHDHRFIYASSAATYGNGSHGFNDDPSQLDLLTPLNLYGYSKHTFDLWLHTQGMLDKVVGLKYFNLFGPNEYHKKEMGSMVMHMVDQIQRTGKVRLFKSSEPHSYGDGEQRRDFYYVKEAVRMTTFFLDHDICGLFNVGSGTQRTWNALAKEVFSTLKKVERIEYISMPEELIGTYQNNTCANMDRFYQAIQKKGLSFENDYTFEGAIQEYVHTYLLKDARW